MRLEGADELLAKKVLVKISSGLRPASIQAIKEAILSWKGTCALTFEVDTETALVHIDAGKDYLVMPGRNFIEQLCGIVGPKGVELQ
jgi:hypothetical protein